MRHGFCSMNLGVGECQRLCAEVLRNDGYHITEFGTSGRRILGAKPMPCGKNYVAIEILFEALSSTQTRLCLSLRGSPDLVATIPVLLPHLLKHLKLAIESRSNSQLVHVKFQPGWQVSLS